MTSKLMCAALVTLVAGSATLADLLAAAQEMTTRVHCNSDTRFTNPGVNRNENTDAVVPHMVEGLVAFREAASMGPLLADSTAVSDEHTCTFVLREDLASTTAPDSAPMTCRGPGNATWVPEAASAALAITSS